MNRLLTRLHRHATLDMIYRQTPLQGTIADPTLPIMGVDYRPAGIAPIQVVPTFVQQHAAPPVPATPITAQPTTPKPQESTLLPMDNPVMSAYKPTRLATDNQLEAIVRAHSRKKESGEEYDKREVKSPWLKGLLDRNAEKERKARIKREARERKVDLKELKRRRAVTYIETGDELPMPISPEPATEEEFLDNIDGTKTDRPFLRERPESDGVVASVLDGISAEKKTDSSIPLVLPRRARPTKSAQTDAQS